jgi:hypothetical protein
MSTISISNKKTLKQAVSRVLVWAQMDLNHRPSDYESDSNSVIPFIYKDLSIVAIVFAIVF